MERIISDNEKIRRAEEIYFRRNNKNINISSENEFEKNKSYLGSRILLKIVLVLNITIAVLGFQNKDFIFTQEFLDNISTFNIDINEKIKNIVYSFFVDSKEKSNEFIKNSKEEFVQNNTENQIHSLNENSVTESQIDNAIESSISENKIDSINNTDNNEEKVSSINQMDLDIQNLENAYYFIKPIDGIVSSSFGARESKYQNVTGYHTGVDIASKSGTIIKASMEGIVSLVSNEGDYRKSYKNSFK